MVVRFLPPDFAFVLSERPDVHVVVFAESGFTMLDGYGQAAGLSVAEIVAITRAVNGRGETAGLQPRLNLSAVPLPAPPGIQEVAAPLTLAAIRDVIAANRRLPQLRSPVMLFDFRNHVEPWVLEAVSAALAAEGDDALDEAWIVGA